MDEEQLIPTMNRTGEKREGKTTGRIGRNGKRRKMAGSEVVRKEGNKTCVEGMNGGVATEENSKIWAKVDSYARQKGRKGKQGGKATITWETNVYPTWQRKRGERNGIGNVSAFSNLGTSCRGCAPLTGEKKGRDRT